MPAFLLALALAAGATDYGAVELCDELGWCVPLAGFRPRSAIASGDALAVHDAFGGVALWTDGAWRTSFWVPADAKLRSVTRNGEQVEVTWCNGQRCQRFRWPEGTQSAVTLPPSGALEPARRPLSGEYPSGERWRKRGNSLEAERNGTWRKVATCGLRLGLLQALPAPVLECQRFTTKTLWRSAPAGLDVLHEPWSTEWADNRIAVFEESAGCAPCFLGRRALWRDAAGWHAVPAPPELHWKVGRDGFRTTQAVRMALGERLVVELDGVARAWNGEGWEPTDYAGPWTNEVRSSAPVNLEGALQGVGREREREGGSAGWAAGTARHLFVFLGMNLFAMRAWSTFEPAEERAEGWARAVGVARGDVLNLRAGPISVAPVVEELAPEASCLVLLQGTSTLSGSPWRLVKTPAGRRGWVNQKFLRALEASARAGCATSERR